VQQQSNHHTSTWIQGCHEAALQITLPDDNRGHCDHPVCAIDRKKAHENEAKVPAIRSMILFPKH
jgi:hypothetical protein